MKSAEEWVKWAAEQPPMGDAAIYCAIQRDALEAAVDIASDAWSECDEWSCQFIENRIAALIPADATPRSEEESDA